MGEAMFSFSNSGFVSLKKGINSITCKFPPSFFQSGQYFLSFYIIQDSKQLIYVENDIISFTVVDSGRELGTYMGREPGFIRPKFEWELD